MASSLNGNDHKPSNIQPQRPSATATVLSVLSSAVNWKPLGMEHNPLIMQHVRTHATVKVPEICSVKSTLSISNSQTCGIHSHPLHNNPPAFCVPNSRTTASCHVTGADHASSRLLPSTDHENLSRSGCTQQCPPGPQCSCGP